ncbi:hypothetical protein JTB14_036155 [Gonioctena quinquepunctata]|nr:hypothetical protein JTB14_036155 [Gonioctena quinquepunctata]
MPRDRSKRLGRIFSERNNNKFSQLCAMEILEIYNLRCTERHSTMEMIENRFIQLHTPIFYNNIMKYPQPVSMPSAVSNWLEEQLEARGIDAVVYTRYVLSLLHSHPVDVIYPDDLQLSHLKKLIVSTLPWPQV